MFFIKMAAAVAIFLCVSSANSGEIRHPVVVPAGGSVAAGELRLSYSVGQPVSGTVEAGSIRLHSGFQALFVSSVATDLIFRNGFDPPSL